MAQNGLTAYRLARETGISEAHVYNVLNGKREATDDVLERIAPHLGVSLAELLARRDVSALGPQGMERIKRYALPTAVFDMASMVESRLDRAVLPFASFRGANLTSASLVDADLSGCDFTGAKMINADFRGTKLAGAIISEADLTGARNLTPQQVSSTKGWQSANLPPEATPGHTALNPKASGPLGHILAELPEDMAYPPTARELRLLSRMEDWEGTELDPRSLSALWMDPPEKRWPELKEAAEASGVDVRQRKAE